MGQAPMYYLTPFTGVTGCIITRFLVVNMQSWGIELNNKKWHVGIYIVLVLKLCM